MTGVGCGKTCALGPGIRGVFRCGAFPQRRLCPACMKEAPPNTITCKTCDRPDKAWNDAHAGFCASCVEAGWEAAYKRGAAEAPVASALTVRDLVSVLFLALAGAGKVWLAGYAHTIGFETKEGADPYMGLVLRDKAGLELARGTIPDVLSFAKTKGFL